MLPCILQGSNRKNQSLHAVCGENKSGCFCLILNDLIGVF